MSRRLGSLLAALALFLTAGGHWAVLQSVAWGQMALDFSREMPVAAALTKATSGQYPCGLCRKIEEGRKTEDRQAPTLKAGLKIEFVAQPPARPLQARAPGDFRYPVPATAVFPVRSDAPPQPIPISGLV